MSGSRRLTRRPPGVAVDAGGSGDKANSSPGGGWTS